MQNRIKVHFQKLLSSSIQKLMQKTNCILSFKTLIKRIYKWSKSLLKKIKEEETLLEFSHQRPVTFMTIFPRLKSLQTNFSSNIFTLTS